MAFNEYSNEFARRYGNMTDAADRQRARDQSDTEKFADQVHSDMAQEAGGPVVPTESASPTAEFDPTVDAEANIEATKQSMMAKARSRMQSVAGSDF